MVQKDKGCIFMGFGGSGGGNGSIAASTDVALSNPINNEVLTYDTTTSKWKNAAQGVAGDGGVVASTSVTGNYTLILADQGKVIEVTSASTVAITLPSNATASFPIGTLIELYRHGAGAVTVVAGSGATLRAPGGRASVGEQYGTVALRKRATNEWTIEGNLA